ncbi:MAG TPA: hypothetical protein VKS22_11175 [Candidatus Binataceae bacterium]|nr:hypothetical protein [Candidatus Binataceae bacterium]
MTASFPFGIKRSSSSSLVVLDKSFLDGNNAASLRYSTEKGWLFALPEVLMYEHFRKEDNRRTANMFKLHAIEDSVFILPGIGEMFRAEGENLKPATTFMPAKRIAFIVEQGPS